MKTMGVYKVQNSENRTRFLIMAKSHSRALEIAKEHAFEGEIFDRCFYHCDSIDIDNKGERIIKEFEL